MSKSQCQLAVQEGMFWDQLCMEQFVPKASSKPDEMLETMIEKSSVMTASYEKRTNAPSKETYHDSKLLLRAMGIPCVTPSGPYEAEALASAMVVSGAADYVASEDTVRNVNSYPINTLSNPT